MICVTRVIEKHTRPVEFYRYNMELSFSHIEHEYAQLHSVTKTRQKNVKSQ